MAEYLTTDSELISIADAIREKGGTNLALAYPTEFVSAIYAIPTGSLVWRLVAQETLVYLDRAQVDRNILTTAGSVNGSTLIL